VYDHMNYLNMDDVVLFDRRICLKRKAEQYLSEKFYEMTALTPYDWKTYENIRVIAFEMYGLRISETHLPSKTTDQNIDILDLARNIAIFVETHHYNLHSQVFVQESTATKQIRTIGVNQLLQSLRTHGYGLVNSMINFIFKFMTKLFMMISEFLQDDYIQSPLLLEAKAFRKSKQELYPFANAMKHYKGIQ
jgi:WASH complex subunit 7